MFFSLKFGLDQELLFNANCCTKILLENIKKRCNVPCYQSIDVADEMAGVKNLAGQPDMKYANLLLQPRGTYILVRVNVFVDERTGDTRKRYTSLLEGLEENNPDFLARLANRKLNQDSGPKERDVWGILARSGTRFVKKRKGQ